MSENSFAHIEMYPIKASTRKEKRRMSARDILEEMARVPGACGHVEQPVEPILLYGKPPLELADDLDALAPNLKDSLGRTNSNRGRVLLASVYSFPVPYAEADRAAERKWASDVVRFAFEYFRKENVKSIVAHVDEKYFHLHVAIVPPLRGDRLAWEEVHPGFSAERAVMQAGGTKKEALKKYKEGLRQFQDEYFTEVSVPNGMTRFGPRRRRVSREELHVEKKVRKLIEQAAGKNMSQILDSLFWKEKFEKAEKEKAALRRYAEAAKLLIKKLEGQQLVTLTWIQSVMKKDEKKLAVPVPSLKGIERLIELQKRPKKQRVQ